MASRFFYLFLLYTFAIERVVSSLVFTNPSLSGLTAGAPFNLTWTGAVGTATVTLQNGTASQIKTVNVVAFGITNSFLLWSPYATTPSGTYILRLDDKSGQSTFSSQFTMLPAGTKTTATVGLQFMNPTFEGITAGQPFNLTWANASGTTTLTLQQGGANGISDVSTIAFGIVDKYIVWSPYATTPAGQYVLKLQDTTGAIAYSNIFNMIVAGSSSSTTRVSSSSTASSTHESATATSPTPTTPSSSGTPQPTLSTGAKAGIGVGASIGGLAIISTLVLLYLRYSIKISKKPVPNSSEASTTSFGVPPLRNEKANRSAEYEQIASLPPAEMGEGGNHPVEMYTDREVHELVGERWR